MIRTYFLKAVLAALSISAATPATAQDPRSCVALDALAERLNSRGTEMVQEIRGIYVEAGLAFGGTRTSSKCSSALRALRVVERRVASGGTEPRDAGIREEFDRESLRFASSSSWRPGFGGDKLSFWTHNGSRMAYESGPGTARRIWYWEPRSGLRGIGVRKGVLLFDGFLSSGAVRGTARIFKNGCGAYLYDVAGRVSGDGRRIVMNGTRPVIADSCAVTGTRPDELIFDLAGLAPPGAIVAAAPAPTPPPVDDAPAPDLGVWTPVWRTHNLPGGDTLNVRAGPSTRDRILGELPNGARDIRVIGEGCRPNPEPRFFESLTGDGKATVVRTSWCRIRWNGLSGWVYAKYIRPS